MKVKVDNVFRILYSEREVVKKLPKMRTCSN